GRQRRGAADVSQKAPDDIRVEGGVLPLGTICARLAKPANCRIRQAGRTLKPVIDRRHVNCAQSFRYLALTGDLLRSELCSTAPPKEWRNGLLKSLCHRIHHQYNPPPEVMRAHGLKEKPPPASGK